MAAFDIQMVARECIRVISGHVVSGLSKGLPESQKPPPLIGPALAVNTGGRLREPSLVTAPAAHPEDGCPACDLHASLADARGLMDGLAASAAADGTLPHPQSGTLPLVEVTLRQAARQTQVIASARPDLAEDARALEGRIRGVAATVPVGGEARAGDARRLAEEVGGCWQESYRLITAYWTRAQPPEGEPTAFRAWYEQAQRFGWDADTAAKRLQEALGNGDG
ncbi:MAG: hypothetical protein ACREN4_07155 [Candidatus Dormibacteria bacterium]